MATINSKKLLPSSKAFSSKLKNKRVLIPVNNVRVKKNIKAPSEDLKRDGSGGISSDSILGIKNIISKIQDVLLRSSIFQKKEQDNKRKGQERETRKRRESKLEKKPTNKNVASGIASLPNLSFIDRIKKFLFWTILGRLFSDLFPKLVDFSKRILPIVDFVENFAGNILKGVIDFIDWGYIAYDKVRDLTKEIGGENAQKTFDDFSKHFNTFLNLALIAAMAGSSIGDRGKTPGGKPGKPGGTSGSGTGAPYKYDRQRALIRKKYGDSAAKLYDLEIAKGKNAKQAISNIESRYIKKGRITPKRMDGSLGGTNAGSKLLSRGFKKAPARLATKMLGKAGVKIAGKVLGRIPIIGGLVDFLFSLWSGEKPGRAAAKAVGATIGSALGTFIPIPLAGTILGGILGDIVGGALYDTLVAGNNKKTQSKAKGGNITRGGKRVGRSDRRSIKVSRVKKPSKIVSQKTIVGKDVGGKNKIEDIYGKGSKKKRRNPIKLLKKASRAVKKNDNVLNGLPAAMFGAGIDMTLGQKPDKNLSIDIGNMFGSIIQTSVNSEVSKLFTDVSSILTKAEGGTIPASRNLKLNNLNLDIGKKIGNEISQKLVSSINSSVNEVFQSLNREFGIKDKEDVPPQYGGGGGALDGIDQMSSLTGIHKQAADIIAGYESATSGGYNAMNRGEPGDSPEGPMHYFGKNLTDMTIGEVVGLQSQGRSKLNAAGRYQFVGNTLPTAMNEANLKPSNKFNALNQDKMFVAHLIKNGHRPWTGSWGLGKYTRQQLDILDRAVKTPITAQTFSATVSPAAMVTGGLKPSQIPLTSGQGMRQHPITGEWKEHKGIDMDGGDGSPISSAQDAKVIWAGDKGDGYGNTVVLKYSNGAETRFAHLKSTNVRTGESIKAGQMIGKQGSTGLSTASHLHFEYYPKGGAMTYAGNGNAFSVKDSYFRYGGNVKPKVAPKPLSPTPLNPGQQPAGNKSQPQALNYGATWNSKAGFSLKGGGFLGSNLSLKVTDTKNTQYREIPQFGLGKGKKEGETKQAKDGNYYVWRGNRWVNLFAGGNASIISPTQSQSSLNQSVAQVSGKYTDNTLLYQRVIIYKEVPVNA